MKKITLTIAAILGVSTIALAQDLYVSPTSYMYVQDEVVFVNDDIRLEAADSNIYLRDDAQLIQNVNIKNSDLGELSVYQEQTGGIYEYSYWCSPVGVAVDGTARGNLDFDVTNFHRPASTAINEITSAQYPTTSTIYDSTLALLSSYWIYKTINAYSYWQWEEVHSDSFVEPGYGYTMKGTPGSTPLSGNTLDFRGRPNTGTMTVPCVWSGTTAQVDYDGLQPSQVESLMGNPYPSSMDLKLLFVDPSNPVGHNRNTFLEQAIYFWEDNGVTSHYMEDYEGGYAEYIPGDLTDLNDDGSYVRATFKRFHINGNGGGTGSNNGGGVAFSTNYGPNHARRYAAIGQGFMVRNINGNAGGNVTVDNSMRVYLKQDNNAGGGDGAIFNRTASTSESNADNQTIAMSHNGLDYMNIVNHPTIVPEIRIHTTINDTYVRENLIAFRANGSETEFKPGFDGRMAQKLATDTYLMTGEDDKLSIKSIAYNVDAKVPFGVVAQNNASKYSITINSLENVSDNVDVFIHDKQNDTYTDIRNGVYEITLDAGEHNDRFDIVFKDRASEELEEIINTEEAVTSSFNVYQNNTNSMLTIKNPKAYIVKSFTMYDVTGKVIYNKQNLGNNEVYTFPTNTLSSGMYVTKVVTDQDFEISKKVMVHN